MNGKDLAKNKSGESKIERLKRTETLFTPEMTDQDILKLIHEDVRSLSTHFWGSLRELLEETGEEESPEAKLLETLVSQNTIVIRQNELILRAVRRMTSLTSKIDSRDTLEREND